MNYNFLWKQNNMKTKIFNFILMGTLLVTGVVSAQTVFAFDVPVHTGGFDQAKQGSFVARFLKAGLKVLPDNIPILNGFIIADQVLSAKEGYFWKIVLPGANAQLRVGTSGGNLFNAAFSNPATVTVDLSGRTSRDAVALLADPSICTESVTMIASNTAAFHFWSTGNGDSADIIGRQVRLSGGNPGPGKMLISTDNQGNATWGTVRVNASGEPVYSYGSSPVPVGQCQ
jgi:hypothetical protein